MSFALVQAFFFYCLRLPYFRDIHYFMSAWTEDFVYFWVCTSVVRYSQTQWKVNHWTYSNRIWSAFVTAAKNVHACGGQHVYSSVLYMWNFNYSISDFCFTVRVTNTKLPSKWGQTGNFTITITVLHVFIRWNWRCGEWGREWENNVISKINVVVWEIS